MSAALNLEIVKPPPKWRTLLILGRVSNLPTVWSNCLAGWWLGGGGRVLGLAMSFLAISCLYVGGMFLNDAFDADFDRRHRTMRPIPAGAISEAEVWRWGAVWMAAGFAGLAWLNWRTAGLALALTACILLYNAVHKEVAFGALLMGACRFFVYLTSAAAGGAVVGGDVIWPALALGLYVTGLSGIARKETGSRRPSAWPALFLAAPIALSLLLNDNAGWRRVAIFAVAVSAWALWSLAQSFWKTPPRIGATVSRLLAGIALVDLLAVASGKNVLTLWLFAVCFGAALFLQRFVPAT